VFLGSFWIIGAGRFGRLAAARLLEKNPRASFLVVDGKEEALREMRGLPVEVAREEGARFLAENLPEGGGPAFIVPAVPVHLAFEWVKRKLAPDFSVQKTPLPEKVLRELPNPIPAGEGKVFASYANWICPDDCPEPQEFCTVTGGPRQGFLFEDFLNLRAEGFTPLAVRSIQLVPGVGGYPPGALWSVLGKIRETGRRRNFLLGTACFCHGVLDSFRLV
jgi:hypothetical protein